MNTNTIHCGDNLKIMRDMPDESVDLIYLDPPFFSNRQYEVIWGDDNETRSFDDRWEGGIEHYIGWMRERLVEMHRILTPTGSIYLHCDWHASHYLKIEMDKIFGMKNFRNEIIWSYKTGGSSKRFWSRKHDTILFYSKTKTYTFNPQKEKSYTKSKSRKPGVINYGGGNAEFFEDENGVYNLINSRDVWEISYINSLSKERLGYPTQKPLTLLEKIIKASSDENDVVFDPFCGCATTIDAANQLGRKWIGIDISPRACDVIATRLNIKSWDIEGMPMSNDDFKKMEHYEFQQWVCTRMEAKNTNPDPTRHGGADGGIDGIVKSNLLTREYGGSLLQVKQSKSVPRDTILKHFAIMVDRGIKTGFVVALSFGKGAIEQVAKYKNDGKAEIILVKAEDIAEHGYFTKV